MTKAPSPLLGFNNNVRHKGRVFHIQTEDSGVRYPHVITHLFADGGRILKSLKTSYAEHVGGADMADKVRGLMKEQHKAMFIALRAGEFDAIIDQDGRGSSGAKVPAPDPLPPSPAPDDRKDSALRPPTVPPASVPRPGAKRASVAPRAPGSRRSSVPPKQPQTRASEPDAAAESAAREAVRLDIDVLERAAQQVQSRSPLFRDDDMPPPPASVLAAKRPSGSYRSVAPPSAGATKPTPQPAPVPERYSASRPASIFATARPSEAGSVFGEDMISSKSLDEVILGFLSEEFGTSPGKEGEGKK